MLFFARSTRAQNAHSFVFLEVNMTPIQSEALDLAARLFISVVRIIKVLLAIGIGIGIFATIAHILTN